MNIREFAKNTGLTYDQASALVSEVKSKINPNAEELEGVCQEVASTMKQSGDAVASVKLWLRARTNSGAQNMAASATQNQLALTQAEAAKFRKAGHYKAVAGMRAMNLGMIEVLAGAEIDDPEINSLIQQQESGVSIFLDSIIEGVQGVEMGMLLPSAPTNQNYLPSANERESA